MVKINRTIMETLDNLPPVTPFSDLSEGGNVYFFFRFPYPRNTVVFSFLVFTEYIQFTSSVD